MMPSGLADATMPAISNPMRWSASMQATGFDLGSLEIRTASMEDAVSNPSEYFGYFTNLDIIIGESY
jgi:hypothetical protein